MFTRVIKPSLNSSFFLFGPRGSGKTHFIKNYFPESEAFYLDLLDPDAQQNLVLRPRGLTERLAALSPKVQWVIIDEIQKIPSLLDVVHQQIERKRFKFALTGSSARKLRRGAANLLAGRAFLYHLFPLSSREIGEDFSLEKALQWGTLPRLFSLPEKQDKIDYLRGYAHVYLQEEIMQEQIVRRLEPFRRFLQIAAQMSGQIVNFSKIARDCQTTVPSAQTYFQILEDTLVGFFLEPFHESVRKRQRESPKFYFRDLGISRALAGVLSVDVLPQTSEFGAAFENFLINEILRLADYQRKEWRFSYLRTKDGVEADMIIERPGLKRAVIEIKSSERIVSEDLRGLRLLAPDISHSEAFCLSRDPNAKKIDGIHCLPWTRGLIELGL